MFRVLRLQTRLPFSLPRRGARRTLDRSRKSWCCPAQRSKRSEQSDAQEVKTLLTEKREEIIKKAKQTLEQDMMLDTDDLPDEMDLASSEYLQSFTFRLRGREKGLLDNIDKALVKIEDGTFGICDSCAEEIPIKRLEARPETTLCVRCKEDQERLEKDYS